jgi:hypothetical protein
MSHRTAPKATARLPLALVALALLGSAASNAWAQTDPVAEAKATIFAKEQKIYASRAGGSMDYYVANTSPNYLGWPPTAPKPIHRDVVAPGAAKGLAGSKEKIETKLVDFTLDGDTALIYYMNHRTARGDGTPVDESFSNIHVWVKRNGEWLLLGGMARPTAPTIK